MNVTRGLLTVLSLLCHTESRCSPTSYYKNCWIRRFPGIFIDIEESQRRGAQLLRFHQEETALKCSRACCLTRNFSCNLAIFHYDTTQENCFHLRCPTAESCVLRHRGNVVLYNITKGVDPDLLVFGKHFTSNVRVLPHHYGRGNASEPLPSDKRHFVHPPPAPAPPPTSAATVQSPTTSTLTQHSAAQPPALHAMTVHVSSTSGTDAQTTTTTTAAAAAAAAAAASTTSLAPSFATPPSSSAANTVGSFDPKTSAASYGDPPAHRDTTSSSQPASGPPASLAPVASTESAKAGPGWNHTAGSGEGHGVSGEGGAGWQAAAHTLLVAGAVCVTVVLGCCCCCSGVLLVSWRGQRKRMGWYRTSRRGTPGSMRLIKYVLVRENT
nr:MANSC domain-containing protein 4-like [Gasterosteus aculeatus aculeatus]